MKKEKKYEVKTEKQLAKEVKADIERELRAIPKEIKQQEEKIVSAYKQELINISKEAQWLSQAPAQEFAIWLIDKHHEYINTVNSKISPNFMDGKTALDKEMIIMYLYNLWTLLEVRRVEHIAKDVVAVLKEKEENDLLASLHMLGYI